MHDPQGFTDQDKDFVHKLSLYLLRTSEDGQIDFTVDQLQKDLQLEHFPGHYEDEIWHN